MRRPGRLDLECHYYICPSLADCPPACAASECDVVVRALQTPPVQHPPTHLNIVVLDVQEPIARVNAAIQIPSHNQSSAGGGAHDAVVTITIVPFVGRVGRGRDVLVLAEAGVHQSVDKRVRQSRLGRVWLHGTRVNGGNNRVGVGLKGKMNVQKGKFSGMNSFEFERDYALPPCRRTAKRSCWFQMCLVDVLGCFRLDNVKLKIEQIHKPAKKPNQSAPLLLTIENTETVVRYCSIARSTPCAATPTPYPNRGRSDAGRV